MGAVVTKVSSSTSTAIAATTLTLWPRTSAPTGSICGPIALPVHGTFWRPIHRPVRGTLHRSLIAPGIPIIPGVNRALHGAIPILRTIRATIRATVIRTLGRSVAAAIIEAVGAIQGFNTLSTALNGSFNRAIGGLFCRTNPIRVAVIRADRIRNPVTISVNGRRGCPIRLPFGRRFRGTLGSPGGASAGRPLGSPFRSSLGSLLGGSVVGITGPIATGAALGTAAPGRIGMTSELRRIRPHVVVTHVKCELVDMSGRSEPKSGESESAAGN